MTRFELVTYRLRIDCTTTVLHRRGTRKEKRNPGASQSVFRPSEAGETPSPPFRGRPESEKTGYLPCWRHENGRAIFNQPGTRLEAGRESWLQGGAQPGDHHGRAGDAGIETRGN